MGSNFKKSPPVLSKASSYEDYKKLLELWTKFSSLDKKEQGTAVLLSLEGKAQEAVLEIDSDIISSEDGVTKIIERLDKIYLKDILIKKYEALDNFENYKRPNEVSVSDYILEFDKRYVKTKNLGTQMSDDLLAYRLLRNANLGDQYTKLVKATAKLEYDSMKQQLKNLFSDASSSAFSARSSVEPFIPASGMTFKQESDTFHNQCFEHDTLVNKGFSKYPSTWRKRIGPPSSQSGPSSTQSGSKGQRANQPPPRQWNKTPIRGKTL